MQSRWKWVAAAMAAMAIAVAVAAVEGLPAIPERSLMRVEWDQDGNYPARLYTNGVLFCSIATNQVYCTGPGITTNGFAFHYYANVIGPTAGAQNLSMTWLDANAIETEFSNVRTQYFSLRAGYITGAKEK